MRYSINSPNMDDLFPKPQIPDIDFPTYEQGKSPYSEIIDFVKSLVK